MLSHSPVLSLLCLAELWSVVPSFERVICAAAELPEIRQTRSVVSDKVYAVGHAAAKFNY